MQNKAKFRKVKLNVNKVLTSDYEQMDTWSSGKKQSQTNPNKAKSNPIKANIMPKQTQFKPKQTQFQKQAMVSKAQPKKQIVTSKAQVYTLENYVCQNIKFLYEVLCRMGDSVRDCGILSPCSFRSFGALQKMVLRPDNVRHRRSIMPLGAFLLSKLFAFPPELAVGLILTGSAPGAMASNIMCYIAKADTAYSVSLTAVSTLLCPLLTPGLTLLLAGSILKVNFWQMLLTVVNTVLVPLLIGFGVRHLFREKIKKVLPVFPAISVTFIIFICSLVIALNRGRLIMITGPILAAGVILNIYGMSAGYGVGSLFRMANKRRRTLAIEIGMQNAGLGVILALDQFNERTAIPAAIFVFICIITASIMAEVWQKRQVTE